MSDNPFLTGIGLRKRTRLGNIKNYAFKDRLEKRIKNIIRNSPIENSPERIIIRGSWGNGSAIPTQSDLDITVLLQSEITFSKLEEFNEYVLITDNLDKGFVLFDGFDITLVESEKELKERIVTGFRISEFNQSKIYDLTNRKVISYNFDKEKLEKL